MKNKLRWKFLNKGIKSASGDHRKWKIGKWEHRGGEMDLCHNGLHCSKDINQAFSFVSGEVLARVEVKGKSDIQDDKEAWSDMRIVKVWKWQKKDSVSLAIYAAELVINIFEKKYPKDKRPRKAIEAAKKWLENPIKKNADAAAHAAAYAADAAAHAAYAAAHAAAHAAHAAHAADAAAHAAYAAAHAASAAADAAARKTLVKKIETWMVSRVKKLEKI